MPKKKSATSPVPPFLAELLEARSPSGYEHEAQAVVDKWVGKTAAEYQKDVLGNRIAVVNPEGDPILMFGGHIDELGLQIRYIDENGFLYFDTIGGHDRTVISGRRVQILAKDGVVYGVTGKKAIHLMDDADRKKVPQTHEIWIDIGAKDRKEAEKRVRIGDCAVYDMGLELISEDIATARAFDDKTGAYTVLEALRRLKTEKTLKARVVSVATTQEEIGTRGAITSSYTVNPDFAIAVDVAHATDCPNNDKRKDGEFKLGGGPMICRGPNINPIVFERLVACAEKANLPYQIEADSRPTPTDARAMQVARSGAATGLVSIPLRYMHTPSEVVSLSDIEHTVQLLVAFAKSFKKGERGVW